MQVPIRLRNIFRANLTLRRHVLQPLLRSRDVNDTIDDGVGDVHSLGSELFGYRGGEGAESPFAAGEGGHLGVGFHAGGGAGENEGWWVGVAGVFGRLEEEGEGGLGED